MTTRPTLTDRLIKAETWIEGHELRCEERYSAIQTSVADLRRALEGWRRGAWALVAAVMSLAVAIIGSLLIQVYDLEPLRMGLGAEGAPRNPQVQAARFSVIEPE